MKPKAAAPKPKNNNSRPEFLRDGKLGRSPNRSSNGSSGLPSAATAPPSGLRPSPANLPRPEKIGTEDFAYSAMNRYSLLCSKYSRCRSNAPSV